MPCLHPFRDLRDAATGERVCRDCGALFLPTARTEPAGPAATVPSGCAHADTQLRDAATGERVCVACGWVLKA